MTLQWLVEACPVDELDALDELLAWARTGCSENFGGEDTSTRSDERLYAELQRRVNVRLAAL
jgi:hypothetical protein